MGLFTDDWECCELCGRTLNIYEASGVGGTCKWCDEKEFPQEDAYY